MSNEPVKEADAPKPRDDYDKMPDESEHADESEDRQVANRDLSTNELSYLHLEAMEELVEVLKDIRDTLQEQPSQVAQNQSEKDAGATTRDGEPVKEKYVLDAEEAAQELREAFAKLTNADMQVTANEGLVWIQTGKDSPDWAWEAFIKEPSQVEYIHEDHEEFDKKPGEWWKNVIVPSGVAEYVEEVLE